MTVQVLFFGATADAAGQRRIEVELELNTKASEVFGKLITDYPGLRAHKLHFSVNQQFSTGDEIIHEKDELAIFTAVSGG